MDQKKMRHVLAEAISLHNQRIMRAEADVLCLRAELEAAESRLHLARDCMMRFTRYVEPEAQADAELHPPGTPMTPPRSFHSSLWKVLPRPAQQHASMLTQVWATADSSELKVACEAGVLAIAALVAKPATPDTRSPT